MRLYQKKYRQVGPKGIQWDNKAIWLPTCFILQEKRMTPEGDLEIIRASSPITGLRAVSFLVSEGEALSLVSACQAAPALPHAWGCCKELCGQGLYKSQSGEVDAS